LDGEWKWFPQEAVDAPCVNVFKNWLVSFGPMSALKASQLSIQQVQVTSVQSN